RGHLGVLGLREVADQVGAPVAVADHPDSDHRLAPASRCEEVPPASRRVSPVTRAGTPVTIAWSGTSRVTTAPAPTSAPSPITTPARIVAFEPIEARRRTRVSTTVQSASPCGR